MHSLDTFWFLLQVCRYLLEAAKSGDVNSTKRWVSCTSDNCNAYNQHRYTPLIFAAEHGVEEVVRVLLEGGANIELTTDIQLTALHCAAWNGHLEVCRLLLDWGAKVDPLDHWKETPLHHAARMGNLRVVMLLVERGADVKVRNGNSQTASDWARREGKEDVVKWLDLVRRG